MGKPKLHLVTQVLNLLDALSDDEKRIIYDRVRPAPKPRQKVKGGKSAQKRKAGKEATVEVCAWESCKKPVDHNVHHMVNYEGYHEFLPATTGEASKGVGA